MIKKPKQAASEHPDQSWVSILAMSKFACGTVVGLAIAYFVVSPIISKIVSESSAEELVGYVKYVGSLITIWFTGYWCPPLPFLPKK